jgi:hypothetical protein
MKIRIPSLPPRAQALYDRWLDWVNVPVWSLNNDGRVRWFSKTISVIEIRRIDILVAIGFVFCVAYYWWSAGWQWAIIGGLMYICLALVGLWML